jgi:predicted Ser/Thr protein kinase/GR25 family glycosyltransferase involved in LPS biosynthesis
LKKIKVDHFTHLKATYWKEKENLEKDLAVILSFLKKFNPSIKLKKIKVNEFSEVNDKNIHIQEGPLGCYCSHLRAMIYGYLNFEDYVLIVEDDIAITNTAKIKEYLKQIPNDWDIVFMNSVVKNEICEEPFYKFKNDFHSAHFYIINKKCMPILFENFYPITDQIDVLISDCRKKLNIYNIEDTVYQKNLKTNTQNNLHVIFNSPNYDVLREETSKIEKLCNFFANKILSKNKKRNEVIVSNLMHDVLYEYILKPSSNATDINPNQEDYAFDISKYKKYNEYNQILDSIEYFINCSKKGIDKKAQAESLLHIILYTLQNFKMHKGKCKAYGFGSSAHTYVLDKKIIIKKYNEKLRWTTEGHDNSSQIFTKEVEILQKIQHLNFVPKLISHEDKTIKMSYEGESLYNQFKLPKDWKEQIVEVFYKLSENKIYYPEFRLQNILVLNKKIKFIDFGLAEFKENADNTENCNRFIKHLEVLNKRFKKTKNKNERYQLCTTFFNNIEN